MSVDKPKIKAFRVFSEKTRSNKSHEYCFEVHIKRVDFRRTEQIDVCGSQVLNIDVFAFVEVV